MSCITEILKLKGDKGVFVPEGATTAIEGGGTYRGYEYLIILNSNGHRCGYVAIPPEHKYSQTPEERRTMPDGTGYNQYDYHSLDIECHGGLTFMSPWHHLKGLLDTPCNDMWIGFDCGHYDDLCDTKAFVKYFGEDQYIEKQGFFNVMNLYSEGKTVKNFDYVESECLSIIEQLIQNT